MDFWLILRGLGIGMNFFSKLLNFSKALSLSHQPERVDYFILDAKKDVTIYKNGHGIIICSYKIFVVNPEKFVSFDRCINIEDGDKDTKFKSLDEMMKCNPDNRFTEMGFWYSGSDDCIDSIEEYYWSEQSDEEDQKSKANEKELRFRIMMNTSKLKRGQTYTITYAISIPGMFPITDGRYDASRAFIAQSNLSSSSRVFHYVRRFTFNVSFDKQILFKESPRCSVYCVHRNTEGQTPDHIHIPQKIDMFYNRFSAVIKNPKNRSRICISWKNK